MKKLLLILSCALLLVGCAYSLAEKKNGQNSKLLSSRLHGDTLTIEPMQFSGMAPYPFSFANTLENFRRVFPFLSEEHFTSYQGTQEYYIYKNESNQIVVESFDEDRYPVIYADISDERIKLEHNIHAGLKREFVLKKLHVPNYRIDIRVLEVECWYERTTYYFQNGLLQRILVQSDNQSIYNPLPAGYREAGYLRGWKGEKLFAEKGTEFLQPVAFLNERGDTIIPRGRYEYIGCDSIAPIGLVAEPHQGIVALNTRGERLFEVMQIDNFQPDVVIDGRFRIIGKNKLVGYADTLGNVIVQPQFQCALPFKNGRAQVAYHGWKSSEQDEHWMWMSDEWFYIDTLGRRLPDKAEQDKR